MAPRTLSRDALKFDRTRFELPKFEMPKLDSTRFDMPSFDRSRLDSFDWNESVDKFEKAMTARLDEVEGRLPSPADRVFHLQRVMAETGYNLTRSATETLVEATNSVVEQARTSTEKVMKTFRDEADTVRSDATRRFAATKSTAADVAAEVRADVAVTTDAVADRIESLDAEAADYSAWTKEDLYERAQELDIAGRSSMSKDELVAAIAGR